MSAAVLSIGSNLGDRLGFLRGCVDAFGPWVTATSGVYETAPWGPVPQQDYLNAVLLVADGNATPRDWLARAHAAEQAAGRTREVHWGPRTLDVDVVAVDQVRCDDEDLTLPHPHAHERAFVLIPWAQVDPEAMLDGYGRVRDLLDTIDTTGVRHRPDLELG
jgi:2-amino-4-hydroxy-6-hydroxymethyldihydropteridine diphosphokinase